MLGVGPSDLLEHMVDGVVADRGACRVALTTSLEGIVRSLPAALNAMIAGRGTSE
jgi:hypothetical protein